MKNTITPSAGGPLPLKPGESPEDACAFVVGYAHERHTPICKRIRAALDRRGEEERAKALREAAKVCDAMSASPAGNGYGNIGNAYDECAEAIRSLAAAPSGDAAVSLGPDRCRSTYKAAVEIERVCTLEFGHVGMHGTFPAPSGDTKAAAPETVAEHLARMGSPAHSICSECPQPAGDAKGTGK